MSFKSVSTLADLKTLDEDDIVQRYRDYDPDFSPPVEGGNRSRGYWHGWCNRARDNGDMPYSPEAAQLCQEMLDSGYFKKLFAR